MLKATSIICNETNETSARTRLQGSGSDRLQSFFLLSLKYYELSRYTLVSDIESFDSKSLTNHKITIIAPPQMGNLFYAWEKTSLNHL